MKIMCMGDSITYGNGLTDLQNRWSDLTAAATGHTMVNLGIGGDTTGGMLARCQTQVFAKDPDVLHVLGGTNDICFTYDYHQAFSNIVSMIRHAQTFEIPILIGIPIPFVPERFANQEWFADRDNEHIAQQCERLAQVLRAFCTVREIPYIDYRSAFLNEDGSVRTDLYTDALHPNAKGHAAMAEVLCQRLEEFFPQSSNRKRRMIMAMMPYRAPWEYETKPFQIVEGVYYVGNKNVSSHLFDTGEGLLLLDTGYTETAYLLLESIREMGFDPHDIRWIVHSHAHYDHFGATRYLVEKFGCKTYMPKKDMPFMTDSVMNGCAEAGLRYEPPYDCYFDVDVQMCDGDVYQFGNITMRVYDAPGHTPGTMAYFFEIPSGLIVGMHGGIGFNTLTSAYAKEHGLGNTWREAYGDTLQNLRAFRTDVVLGNHPSQNQTFAKQAAMTPDHNPFIDEDGWNKFLDWVQGKYEDVVKKDPL